MGVKVYFFVNYQPVMLDSDWYKKELVKYREQAPDGGLTWNDGWGMGTLWARMGHPKLMTWADPAFPQYRKIIVDQFAKLAQIGADGVHVDKMFPAAIDYNPDLPMSPDTAPWEGAILLTKEVFAACRKIQSRLGHVVRVQLGPDAPVQRRHVVGRQPGHHPALSFPRMPRRCSSHRPTIIWASTTRCAKGTRSMLGPLNFCRSVGWKPWEGLADYIKEVKRIQDSLLDTVYLGEVLGHDGVRMPQPAPVDYNVFRNIATGKRVCILTNSRWSRRSNRSPRSRPRPGGEARIHAPFQPARVVKLPAEIEIPAERIVFVEEL